MDTQKECWDCGETKLLTDFYGDNRGCCKPCFRLRAIARKLSGKRKCNVCDEIKDNLEFEYNGRKCKTCRDERNNLIVNGLKKCKNCKETKPESEFNKRGLTCKKCNWLIAKPAAQKRFEKIEVQARKRETNRNWRVVNPELVLLNSAKRRAKIQNCSFNLEPSDIIIPEFCPVFGIKLEKSQNGAICENSPTLDKIVPELGYIKGNIRVISNKANRLKNNMTLDELEKLVKYVKESVNLSKSFQTN